MRYMLLVIALVIAGCAQEPKMGWAKVGSTEAMYNADMGQCRAQAFGVPGAMYNLVQVAIVQRTCMEGKGYYLAPMK